MERDTSQRLNSAASGEAEIRAVDAPIPDSAINIDAKSSDPEVAHEPSNDASSPEPTSASVSLRIGVFEDSYSTLRVVMKAFKERGYQVDHFAQLEAESEVLTRGRYDALIVSDTMIGGAEACQRVIARVRSGPDKVTASIPILALTSRGDASRRRVLELLGASATLSEPTEARLVAALLAALDHEVPTAHGEPRMLLLEDSYSLSLLLSDGLARGARAVDHFATTDQAIGALNERDYEVLVLSQNDQTGQLSCVQLIEYARLMGKPGVSSPRVFVLTDNPEPENADALMRAGAECVLHKSNPEQLGTYILNLIEAKSADPSHPELAARAEEISPPVAEYDAKPPISSVRSSLLFAQILAIAMLIGVAWFVWQVFSPSPRVSAARANVDTVEQVLRASGNVISQRQVKLAPSLTGQLYHVYLGQGDLVRKGETLATLDNREAIINVRRAEAQMYRYRTEVNLANKALKGLTAQADATNSRRALLDLEKERAQATAQLRAAEQALQTAQLTLDRLSITAPFAGVLIESNAIEGMWAEAGVPVYTLADLETQEVAMRVDAETAEQVSAGYPVRFSVNNALDQSWDETIVRVVPDGNAPDGAASGGATIYASLGDNGPLLPFGARVNAQIITAAVSGVVVVPREAIVVREGASFVGVIENDKINFRPVDLGLQSSSMVEIRSGVMSGEIVALSAGALRDGQSVDVDLFGQAAPIVDAAGEQANSEGTAVQ